MHCIIQRNALTALQITSGQATKTHLAAKFTMFHLSVEEIQYKGLTLFCYENIDI